MGNRQLHVRLVALGQCGIVSVPAVWTQLNRARAITGEIRERCSGNDNSSLSNFADTMDELLRAYKYRLRVVSTVLETLTDAPFHITYSASLTGSAEGASRAHRTVETVQRDVFRWLMCADAVAVASELAAGELFECLEEWCAAYHQAVSGYYLCICESIPETVNPVRYRAFLARAFGKTVIRIRNTSPDDDDDDNINNSTTQCALTQPRDFTALEARAGISVGPFNAAEALPTFLPVSAYLAERSGNNASSSAVSYPAGAEALAQWVSERAAAIDRLTGMAENASALVCVCTEQPLAVPGLEDLAEAVGEVVYAVYGKPQAQELTLEGYLAMDDVERLCVLTRGTTAETIVDVLKKAAKPLLDRCNAPLRKKAYSPEQHSLLERYFVRTIDTAPDAVAAVVAYRFRTQDRDLFPLVEYALTSVVPCVLASTLTRAWDSLLRVFAGLPPLENFRVADQAAVRPLYARVAEARALVETGRVLYERFGIEHTVAFYAALSGSRENLCALMAGISKRMASLRTGAEVAALREGMLDVLVGFLQSIPAEADRAAVTAEVDDVFFRDLLRYRFFAVAKAFQSQHAASSAAAASAMSAAALEAARAYTDGARSLTDPALGAAKECLALLEYSKEKAFERRLLFAAEYLARRGVASSTTTTTAQAQSVRPKELRGIMAANDACRVAALLLPTADPCEDLVKAVQEVIPDIPDDKVCEIRLMAARKALETGHMARALELCDELAAAPYPRAASLAAELLARDDLPNASPATHSRLVVLCLLSSSRPGARARTASALSAAECLAKWRAVNHASPATPPRTAEERIRFALTYFSTSQRVAFAALAPVDAAAAAEHRTVFLDVLTSVAAAATSASTFVGSRFERTAHFALHFLAARIVCDATARSYFDALATPTTALLRRALAEGESAKELCKLIEEIRALAKHRAIAQGLATRYGTALFDAAAFYSGNDEDRKRIFLSLMRAEKDPEAIRSLTEASVQCGIPEYELSISTVCWMFSAEFGGSVKEIQDAVSGRKDVLAQYPAATLRGLADVFPAMPPSDYQRFGLYFATVEEFAAKVPDSADTSLILARDPVRKVADYKRLAIRVGSVLPHANFFRLVDPSAPAVDAMEEWLTPEININACLRLVDLVNRARGGSAAATSPLTKNDVYLRWALHSLRPYAVATANEGDSDETLQKKSAAVAELWASKFKVLKTALDKQSLTKLLDTLLHDVVLFAEPRLAILNEVAPLLADDNDSKPKYSAAQTALEGQVAQRAFLPDGLKTEFDCLGVVVAPEERKRRCRAVCEQMIRFGIDSGSIYDLLACLQADSSSNLLAEGVSVYETMCDVSFSEKLPIPKMFKVLVVSCAELPRPGQPREREDFMFQCRDKVVARVKAFIAEKPAMAPVQAVILELLESTLTRPVLLRHGLSASSVSLKVGALYTQCFPASGSDEAIAALLTPSNSNDNSLSFAATTAAVPIPSVSQILAFFRRTMDGGVTPEQLKCLGGMLSIWEDHLPSQSDESAEAATAASPLSPCWLMLFSTMVQAGMTQDMIDLRRKHTQKEILSKEDEAALCKSLPSQVAAAFVLASSSENKQEIVSDLLSSPAKTPEPLGDDDDDDKTNEKSIEAETPLDGKGRAASCSSGDEGRDIVLCRHPNTSRSEIERRHADEEQLYRIALSKNNVAKFVTSYSPSVLARVVTASAASADEAGESVEKIADKTNSRPGQQPRAAALLGCYYNPVPTSFIHTTSALYSLNRK